MTPSHREPEQETMNELETIPFTLPLDRPEPQPQQSPGRLELERRPLCELAPDIEVEQENG